MLCYAMTVMLYAMTYGVHLNILYMRVVIDDEYETYNLNMFDVRHITRNIKI